MDWKQPFEIAFELGLWAIGWALVAIIGMFVLVVLVAIVKGFIHIFRGKKISTKPTKASFRLVKGDGKKE